MRNLFLTILTVALLSFGQVFAATTSTPPQNTQSVAVMQDQVVIAQAQLKLVTDQDAQTIARINQQITNLQTQIKAATPAPSQ